MSLPIPETGRHRPLADLSLWRAELCVRQAALWAVILGAACALPFANTGLELPADTLWLMHVAQGWLAGATPYADAIETNPPMSVLLYAPAALAVQWLHLDLGTAVRSQTLITAFGLVPCASL